MVRGDCGVNSAEWRHASVGLAGIVGILILSAPNRPGSAFLMWIVVVLVASEVARRL